MLLWADRMEIGTLSFWALQRDNGGCPGRKRLLREFCDGGYAGWRITRLRRRGKPARPYIWRLIILILLTLPSMAPEL